MTHNANEIKNGQEAVFLPGKIHGAEHQLYILSMNWDANDGNGSFEIEIVDADGILQAYKKCDDSYDEFFYMLPDIYQNEWYYCNAPSEDFDSYVDAFFDADFVLGRDGDDNDEMLFLVNWARERKGLGRMQKYYVEFTATYEVNASDELEAENIAWGMFDKEDCYSYVRDEAE